MQQIGTTISHSVVGKRSLVKARNTKRRRKGYKHRGDIDVSKMSLTLKDKRATFA